ncbi:sugar transferase [Terriglobus roseus]|uniref:Exopolysaccharide biosynthesis polyprenyl glycosylphosphotransferase n=1 Tax=Terriglobus roseus TaxID=392734 RepID=A0A1H4TXP1_9BACT|nr:sugar transferase [Terriglobus roseus]SEC61207.1 exopolysaccharide biosynthesis polyprenyl glycosylphosphotransferase [Terriglobus roseus]
MPTADPVRSVAPLSTAKAIHSGHRIAGNFNDRLAVRFLGTSAVACMDLLLLSASFVVTTVLCYRLPTQSNLATFLSLRISMRNLLLGLACVLLWHGALWASGIHRSQTFKHQMRRIPLAICLTTLVAMFAFFQRSSENVFFAGAVMWLLSLFCFCGSRLLIFLFVRFVRAQVGAHRSAIVVGSGSVAQDLCRQITADSHSRYKVIGFVDSAPQEFAESNIGQHLGTFDQLEEILLGQPVDDVFIALPQRSSYVVTQRALALCEIAGIQSHLPANNFQTSITKRVSAEGSQMVLHMVHHDSRRFLKRSFDLAGASFGLLLLSPLLLVIAILVKLTSDGPIIFKQKRYGWNRRIFHMYKFRSMVVDAEKQQAKLEHLNELGGPVFKITNDPRVTKIGAFIRKTSLDELPQLFNVLRGEMSLVGPRPLPMRDVGRVNELSTMRRFSVKPGMTGLWQVSGRSSLDFSGWMTLDLSYIDEWSLGLDLRILAQTFPAVMKGRGAS